MQREFTQGKRKLLQEDRGGGPNPAWRVGAASQGEQCPGRQKYSARTVDVSSHDDGDSPPSPFLVCNSFIDI